MKSNSVVVDTSALISLFSPKDSNHKKSEDVSLKIKRTRASVIIPGEIITEMINVFGKKVSQKTAVLCGRKVLITKEYIIVETTLDIRELAFKKFKRQPRSVSFTDCLVMAFADEFETKKIFGFDETFRKNGYLRVGLDEEK